MLLNEVVDHIEAFEPETRAHPDAQLYSGLELPI